MARSGDEDSSATASRTFGLRVRRSVIGSRTWSIGATGDGCKCKRTRTACELLQHRFHVPVDPRGSPCADRLLNTVAQDVHHVRRCGGVAFEGSLVEFAGKVAGLEWSAAVPGAVLV